MPIICPFIAVFPDPYSATHLTHLANSQRAKHGLPVTPIPERRFHLSVLGLACNGAPEDLVPNVSTAAEEAAGPVPPFNVELNRTGNFGGGRALVVHNPHGNAELHHFRQRLGMALRDRGVQCSQSGFHPHVTLLYKDRTVPEESIEPVSWVVNQFALVFSFVGETKYIVLEPWKLRG